MFSTELIRYTISYFKENYNHEISAEKAELYLNQCAELFGAFKSLLEENQHMDDAVSMIQ